MDDQLWPGLGDQPLDARPVANVELVVREVPRRAHEPLEVRRRVAVVAEEVAPHVVVDALDSPAALVEKGDAL